MISVLFIALAEAGAAFVISILSLIHINHSEKKIEEYNTEWQVRIAEEKQAADRARISARVADRINAQQGVGPITQNPFVASEPRPKRKPKVKSKPVVVEPPTEAVLQLPIERFYDDPRLE